MSLVERKEETSQKKVISRQGPRIQKEKRRGSQVKKKRKTFFVERAR